MTGMQYLKSLHRNYNGEDPGNFLYDMIVFLRLQKISKKTRKKLKKLLKRYTK
jgi:hypothetical protein